MHEFTVQVIDAKHQFHAYVQTAACRAEVEDSAFQRFGELRVLSIRRWS